jgi:hypothetical protein
MILPPRIRLLLVSLIFSAALPASSRISMGNGSDNWIVTEGASRSGSTFTFREVKIAGAVR